MAVMNARNQGSATGFAVLLFALGIVAALAGLLAIVFKSQLTDAHLSVAKAESELKRIVSRSEMDEQNFIELKEDAKKDSKSVVGLLRGRIDRLKHLIDQSPGTSVSSIEQLKEDMKISAGQTFVSEIDRLRAELEAARKRAQTAEDMINVAKARAMQIESEKDAQVGEYELSKKETNDRLTALQSDSRGFRDDVEAQREKFENHLETIRSQKQGVIDELESTLEQQNQQIVLLKQRIEEITVLLPDAGGVGPDPTREADGKITAVLPEENLVYIDRGQTDRVMLGMTFEVFDANTGVLVDNFGDLRGYATLEVIDMSGNASLARVVRLQRGKTLDEGDLISNIVYDPNATYKFFVFGRFDIDNTGQSTTTDRRRIETIINKWGGLLAQELTYSTDFLVLGEEPALPDTRDLNVTDPEVIARKEIQRKTYEKYQDLIGQAKSLSIPILNQNRFLALVGYYRR